MQQFNLMNSSILKKWSSQPNQSTLRLINDQKLKQNQLSNQTKPLKPQITLIPIAPLSLTHEQLAGLIQRWDVLFRIQEKFDIWELQFNKNKMKHIQLEFYNLLIHYFCLKKLYLTIKDYRQNIIVQVSFKIKQIYKTLSLSGKLKGNRFNCLLLLAVKLISYFIGSHTSEVDTDFELQTQIFVVLNYVILGMQVASKTYKTILDQHSQKNLLLHSRNSVFLRSLVKKKSNAIKEYHQKASHSKKRIGKYSFKSGSALFQSIYHEYEPSSVSLMHTFKEQVRANLFVKQFIPKPKLKQNLNELIQKNLVTQEIRQKNLSQVKLMENQMKNKKIFFTQLSSSMDLNDDICLNQIKSHYIKSKPQKKSKNYYQIAESKIKKLKKDQTSELKQLKNMQSKSSTISVNDLMSKRSSRQQKQASHLSQSFQLPVLNSYQQNLKKKKQSKYWKQVIDEMKQNKFRCMQKFPPINSKYYFKKNSFNQKYRTDQKQNNNMYSQLCQNQSYTDNGIVKKLQNKVQVQEQERSFNCQKVLNLVERNQKSINNALYYKKIQEQKVHKQSKKGVDSFANYSQLILQKQGKLPKKTIKKMKQMLVDFQKQCRERQEKTNNFYIRA